MGQKGRVITGARLRFMLAGKKVGYATGVSGREEIEYQPCDVLDNVETEEYVPVGYRVQLRANFLRIYGETPKGQGYMPKTGTTPEKHLENILLQDGMTAVLEDSKEKKPIEQFMEVKVAARDFTAQARGITAVDVEFVALRNFDESES
jgi:sulfur transfer complex TusBCD TusB component (DsrH family)